MKRIFRLKGVIQPYAWGGSDFIPGLTGQIMPGGQPAAEYWLGAHPNASSLTDTEGQLPLHDLIRENKHYFLGDFLSQSHSSLPFLLKVLDVKQMLSIQVHPDRQNAEKGYDKEDAAGIPLLHPGRNYKDRNEKAEMMIALGEFWLLHGFRPQAEMQQVFDIPEFSNLRSYFDDGGYEGLYRQIMLMEQAEVNEILKPLAERVTLLETGGSLKKDQPDFWAARALKLYSIDGKIDRGIFSIYLLNLLQLKKGECIYQPPGMLHAYLEGRNIEVMSNSDNVLRAGLTPKHIDVIELLKHVNYQETMPEVLKADKSTGLFPVPDLSVKQGNGKEEQYAEAPVIILVMDGEAELTSGDERLVCSRGEAVFIVPETVYSLITAANSEYYVITVPKKGE